MFRSPSTRRPARRPSPVWSILLVVPPVLVLSVAALYSLHGDRAAIERDARRNAGVLAADLAPRWGERVGRELATLVASTCAGNQPDANRPSAMPGPDDRPLCGLIVEGRVRVPLEYLPVPSPPDWPRDIAPGNARTLRLLSEATPQTELEGLRRASGALPQVPAELRANAEWYLARAEANRHGAQADTARLTDLARRFTGLVSESGAPLSDLALLLALRHLPEGELPPALLEEMHRRVVESPSFMTAALVEEAARLAPRDRQVASLRERWTANDHALALMRRLPDGADRPTEVWLSSEQGDWLALVHPLVPPSESRPIASRTAYHVTLVPAVVIERVFRSAVLPQDDVPKYLTARVRISGRTWNATAGRAGSQDPAEVASASAQLQVPLVLPSDAVGTFAGELLRIAPQAIALRQETPGGVVRLSGVPGGHPFTLFLELTDPDLLYRNYRVRLWMAIGLILIATLAAFAGLAAASRAFGRERRLAEMKSDFVANVSHELRAPVAAVRLMAESLERGAVEPGERQREYLRLIGQECRRLSSLVANVLDFSRIDRGRRQYSFEPADLRAVVTETADVMRAYAAERDVKLVCASPPAGAALSFPPVDRAALQQALINLVDNAVKHSPPGAEVVVGLESEQDADRHDDVRSPEPGVRGAHVQSVESGVPGAAEASRGASVRLFVQDHGPGIPLDEQERIFEPFHRLETGLRRETQGVGIGLRIVKHVAEAHGGRVLVRSSPGQGSRFVIELPG